MTHSQPGVLVQRAAISRHVEQVLPILAVAPRQVCILRLAIRRSIAVMDVCRTCFLAALAGVQARELLMVLPLQW